VAPCAGLFRCAGNEPEISAFAPRRVDRAGSVSATSINLGSRRAASEAFDRAHHTSCRGHGAGRRSDFKPRQEG